MKYIKQLLLLTIFIGQMLFAQATLDTLNCEIREIESILDFVNELEFGDGMANYAGFIYTASSTLDSQNTINYLPSNLHDYNINTAWVEGKKDYGIGEKINIRINMPAHIKNIRLDFIEFLNGYAKSNHIWEINSRVKQLKMYRNDKPRLVITLSDINWPQLVRFPVDTDIIVNGNDKITLEILDIYPGSKYKDTAISEIVFGAPM